MIKKKIKNLFFSYFMNEWKWDAKNRKIEKSGKSIFDLRSNNWLQQKSMRPRRKNFTSWNNWNTELSNDTLIVKLNENCYLSYYYPYCTVFLSHPIYIEYTEYIISICNVVCSSGCPIIILLFRNPWTNLPHILIGELGLKFQVEWTYF